MKTLLQYILEYVDTDNDKSMKAMLDYVLGITTNVNNYLRDGKVIIAKKKIDHAIKYMDQGFIDTWHENTPLYRTVDWDFMKNVFGITKENIDEKIGVTITDKGYMSTTHKLQSPWGKSWNDWELVLKIVSNKPFPCFDVNKNIDPEQIDCEEQCEILLPRNQKLKFVGYEIKKHSIKQRQFTKEGTYILEFELL